MKHRSYTKLDTVGKTNGLASWLFTITIFGLIGFGFTYRQQILDTIKLYNYVAPSSIAQLATEDTMTPDTRRIFYVNRPLLQDKATFKAACPNGGGEKTIILGCYHGNQNGIFLYQVADSRLNGVTQVTAAHELLHAAYDRLSSGERQRIDTMLVRYYQNDLKDQRIKDTIDGYKKSEPKDVVNEMHSIFGTEVTKLPADLESYYSRYFTNRSKITDFTNQYQAEFSSRQALIKQDDAQLLDLKQKIETLEAALGGQQAQITTRQQELLDRRKSGDTAGYNAGVAGYNSLIDDYNRQVRLVQSLVSQYNQLVASRNEIASQVAELSNALSSNATQLNQ